MPGESGPAILFAATATISNALYLRCDVDVVGCSNPTARTSTEPSGHGCRDDSNAGLDTTWHRRSTYELRCRSGVQSGRTGDRVAHTDRHDVLGAERAKRPLLFACAWNQRQRPRATIERSRSDGSQRSSTRVLGTSQRSTKDLQEAQQAMLSHSTGRRQQEAARPQALWCLRVQLQIQANLAQANVGLQLGLSANAPDGTYFIRVVAVNAFGQSSPSNELALSVTASSGQQGQLEQLARECVTVAIEQRPNFCIQNYSGAVITIGNHCAQPLEVLSCVQVADVGSSVNPNVVKWSCGQFLIGPGGTSGTSTCFLANNTRYTAAWPPSTPLERSRSLQAFNILRS